MTSREIILDGGLPWGFRMHGGADVQQPLRISRVNPGSKAALRGIHEGDLITSINNQSTRSLTNTEAHSLIKTAGATLKLGLNQEFSGSPNKRRQYKTIQETHSETVKRSSITTYSIKSSRLVESASVEEEANGAVVLNNNEVSKPQNGEPNKSPPSLIASQRSTLSTNGSSNPSTPTILTDHENLKSSPDNAELSNSSSIYTEQGTKDDMPDDKVASSKAKRRRARRKNAKNSKNQEENTTSKIIITKEFEETKLDYRVDSPDQTKERTKVTSKVAVTKSKSLDDDDLLKIQELSETSETEDKHESQAIISEAESELEWEETTNLQTPLSTLCLPIEEQCVEQVILISPEEELTLRNFLEGLNLVNSPEDAIKQTLEISTEDSMKARKAKKRAALEQYFLPMMQNPRYLDVISEEASDQSDLEPPPSIFTQHLKQGTPELDIIIPETTKSKPVLVETKLIEQGFCSTSNIGSVLDAEVVYINDSSSNSPNTLSDYEDCKEDINSSTESCEENLKIKVITELTPPPTPEISSPKSELNVPAEVDQEITALTENIKEKISCRNVISPPAPSRSPSRSSGSSSREASLCTIKYNPNSSIGDITSISKEDEVIKVYFEPSSLRELCLKCLASLPFGLEVLQELADVSLSIDSLTAKLPSDVLPKIARKLPAYLYDSNMNSNLPVSDSEAMPKWIGLPTETDPKLLMCLSPKQKDQLETTKATPNEADKLLELHEKFIQRRSYHEESKTVTHLDKSGCEVLINSPKNASNRLLAIIREEPQSPSVQTSAASSTSSKPNMNYSNRERSATLPRAHSQEVMNEARLKAKDLTEWLELARDKSRSDTNLWNGAELKCATTPLDTNKRVHQNTTTTRRLSLPQELYERQLLYLQEKEREVYRELERLEDEKRKLSAEMAPPKQFQTNEYHISRKGDYAENKSSLRPHSMPVIPTEFLRQQMYDEYMHQIAEREERRQHKVIKLSSCKTNLHEETIKEANEIEDEFMKRVWQKHEEGKLNLERRKNSPEGGLDKIIEELGVLVDDGVKSKLPKHLQEFVDITKQASENSTDDDDGVWSPGQSQRQPERIYKEIQKSHQPKEEDPNIQPIWVPKSANSSPIVERKEFRPVNFQSPVLSRKSKPTTASFEHLTTSNSAEPSWKLPESSSQTGIALSASLDKRLTSSQSSPNIPSPRLPKAQNPTITLLQKAREGQLPRGAHYLDYQDQRRLPNDRAAGIVGPGEVLYKLKGEYTSESDSEHPRRMADLGQRKYEQGIGPTTKNGMPLTLRSEIKEGNQSKWYKRMYDTIHKQKPHTNEYVTVRYKQRRANYPYSSGYLSEPEPGMYDSDFTDYKYATLDRRRQPMNERHHENGASSTMPRNYANKSSSSSDIIRNAHESYRNQPGRIENYRPGHSSISEKEAKEWWDEVMDIFDGHLDQQKRVPQNKSFINQALKSGYESDSTLVYRRKEEASQLLSPIEQKEAYKVIQKGGDVPLHGLRKPAPERPKDPEPPVPPPKGQYELRNLQPESPRKYVENEVTIHYKTPIRQEIKECLSEDELAYRQAEIMKKIYQEERRKKYLQELQDMNSRRHTDNFIPSQKSPISLNRYDDFEVILPPTKPPQRSPEPRLIAKALYNFLGQTSRELTFRKGDLIHVRRQVDKNWYEGELNAMVGLFPFNYVEIVPHDTVKATTTTPRKSYEGQARAKFNFIAQSHLELSLAKGELVVITRRVDDNWYEGKIGGKKGIFPVNYVDVLIDPHDPPPPSTKPVASPASHSMLHNGTASGKESMGTHLYTPSVPNPQLGSSYHAKPVQITGAGTYGSLSRALKNNVDQALHIETASEPIPYRALYNYNPQNDDELELLEKDLVFVLEKCDDGWYVGSSERTGAFGTFPGNYVEKI